MKLRNRAVFIESMSRTLAMHSGTCFQTFCGLDNKPGNSDWKDWKMKWNIPVVYHLHGKTGWSTVCTNGKRKFPMKNFDQDWRVPYAQRLPNDTWHASKLEYGLELVKIPNGKHIFRSEIPVGNFGLPFKTFRKFWKISGRGHQNSLNIYILTEISETLW